MKRLVALLLLLMMPFGAMAETVTLVPQTDGLYKVMSASPDGTVELCLDERGMHLRRGDHVIPLTLDTERGVTDDYGNLQKIAMNAIKLAGTEVTWSLDGKYATVTNARSVIEDGYYFMDPVVIDTVTGEIILLATSPDNIWEKGASAVVGAEFSSDSKYLYTLLYGDLEENLSTLVRYDLESMESELLWGSRDVVGRHALCMTAEGTIMFIEDEYDWETPASLICLSDGDSGFTEERVTLNAVRYYCAPKKLLCSRKSGWTLMLAQSKQVYESKTPAAMPIGSEIPAEKFHMYTDCLIRIQPGQEALDAQTGWWIPSMDASAAESFQIRDYGMEVEAELDGVAIDNMVLSPDGEYALLLANERTDYGFDYGLLLLRLSDMTLTRVTGVDEGTAMVMFIFGSYMSWAGDTISLGETMDTSIPYKFQ